MMTPDQINGLTIDALREAREAMMSADWQLEMDSASADVRRRSGLLLGMVQGEILRLENAQLAAIAASLAANGTALEVAAKDVKRELKKIAKVEKVLKVVDDLVKLAIKVVPKALGLMGSARLARGPAAAPAAKPRAKASAKAASRAKTASRSKARPAKSAGARKPAAKGRRKPGTRPRAR